MQRISLNLPASRSIPHIALMLGCLIASLPLTGCGFALRGQDSVPLAPAYQQIRIETVPEAQVLQPLLTSYLRNLGAQVNVAASPRMGTATVAQQSAALPMELRIERLVLQRQPLSGKLTEVQLRLTSTFRLYQQGQPVTASRTVIAQRSYQDDRASVNIDNQEESYLIGVMQDDIAQQIVRLLHTNRLPPVDPRQIDQAP